MTIPITTRSGKGAPLTNAEMDNNLTSLARDASNTQQGNIEIATQAEVDTGTSTTLAVVPSTLKGNLDTFLSGTLGNPGGMNFPIGNNSLEIRWGFGTYPTESGTAQSVDEAISFSPVFTSAPFLIIGGAKIGKAGTGTQQINSLVVNHDSQVSTTTTGAGLIISSNSPNVNHTGATYYWLALSVN